MRTGVTNSILAVSLCQNLYDAHTLEKRPRKAITTAEGHFAPAAAVHQRLASAKTPRRLQ